MAGMHKFNVGINVEKCRARRGKYRRGNAVVFVGMMLPVMCGFIALAVDYGFLLYIRADLQRSADHAVLAAVRDLEPSFDGSQDLDQVRATLREFAQLNAGATISILDNDIQIGRFNPLTVYTELEILDDGVFDTVVLTLRRDDLANSSVSLFFAKLFGNQTTGVSVTSTAVLQKAKLLTEGTDILPVGIPISVWLTQAENSTWSIYGDGRIKNQCGSEIPGNWGTINVGSDNNSTSALVDQINVGLKQEDLDSLAENGRITTNEYIDSQEEITLSGDPGFSAGIKSAVIAAHGQSKLVPLFDHLEGFGGNLSYDIVGWGVVQVVTSTWKGSKKSSIT
ncbi:MAG: hypothetical protein GY880_03525, partial [Planctomycetaceae bacterium]|nr:hypothetical protein [Planctomycetaceae bacterium]